MFIPDDCVMSNDSVPMLAVERPDLDDSMDPNTTEKLINSIARLQGTLSENRQFTNRIFALDYKL